MDRIKLTWFEWRMAILYGLLFSMTALISSFLTGVMEIDFPALSHWKQFLIILGVALNWGNTMMAFLTNVAKKAQQGKLPFFPDSDGDTQVFTKTTTDATSKQLTVVSTTPIPPTTNEVK